MTTVTDKTLLIIDDDRFFCKTLHAHLKDEQYEILSAHSLKEGERLFKEKKSDVILLDQKLPDGNGIELCNSILASEEQVKIIFITAFPSFDNAVKALRNGAYDYLSKPVEIEEVGIVVNQAFRTLELENVELVQKYKDQKEHIQNVLIGKDSGLRSIFNLIQLSSANDVPVLITGETGTGKNVVAKNIHYHNRSRRKSFIDINCAALPENLIEAELFGYEKGAFTGATATKKGIFELADGGTLFLDEIGELPMHLQSKLLGVLDEHKVKRLGAQSYKKINIKIIAATNVDLQQAVEKKLFRQDLYFRLSVLPIHIPPLRERKEDIRRLCVHFLENNVIHQGITLPEEELAKMLEYSWPGNVRELKNIMERALIFQRDNTVFPAELLSQHRSSNHEPATSPSSILPLAEMEREYIYKVLSQMENNHTKAANALGIARSTLLRKLKGYSN